MTRYVSTRGQAPAAGLAAAVLAGIAPDGGLYVPQHFLRLDNRQLAAAPDLAATTATVLAPFLASEPALLPRLPALCRAALDFGTVLRPLRGDRLAWLLELFHGPTGTFKDVGARFLARLLPWLPGEGGSGSTPARRTLLVAGPQAGSALASACRDLPGLAVVVLYPDRGQPMQAAQRLAAIGRHVRVVVVQGNLDQCRDLQRRALADACLQRQHRLLAGDGINPGWWLPQMGYWVQAALQFQRRHGELLNVIIPAGDLGNACAALLARSMGTPLGQVLLAGNANLVSAADTNTDTDTAGTRWPWPPGVKAAATATLAPAMDVIAPANLERLRWLHPDAAARSRSVPLAGIDDPHIRATISATWRRHGLAICPHTACAMAVLDEVRAGGDTRPWAVAATAHPDRFAEVVGPLAGRRLRHSQVAAGQPVPDSQPVTLPASWPALRHWLLAAAP